LPLNTDCDKILARYADLGYGLVWQANTGKPVPDNFIVVAFPSSGQMFGLASTPGGLVQAKSLHRAALCTMKEYAHGHVQISDFGTPQWIDLKEATFVPPESSVAALLLTNVQIEYARRDPKKPYDKIDVVGCDNEVFLRIDADMRSTIYHYRVNNGVITPIDTLFDSDRLRLMRKFDHTIHVSLTVAGIGLLAILLVVLIVVVKRKYPKHRLNT
jgi:hypothetical protein